MSALAHLKEPVISRRICEILPTRELIEVRGDPNTEVRGVTNHSKKVEKGCVFVAVPGTREDGAAYAQEACHRGAAVVVAESPLGVNAVEVIVKNARRAQALMAEAFYNYPSSRLVMAGITGTNGKSSTAVLLKAMLDAGGVTSGLLGTIFYDVVAERRDAPLTTPDSIELRRLLAEMRHHGATHCVMEVSSHAIALDRVYGVNFAAAVFTSFSGKEHTDFHGSDEAYLEQKMRLFESLGRDSCAVLNWDDPTVRGAEQRTTAGRKLRYGFSPDADVRVLRRQCSLDGTVIELMLPGGERVEIRSRLLGGFVAYNVAAAAAAAIAFGLPLEVIKRGAESVACVPGRMERVTTTEPFTVLVDFAHNCGALETVMRTLREDLRVKRLIAVFGCGGDRDPRKRAPMGRVAERYADFTILTADNSRTEPTEGILKQIASGFEDPSHYEIEPDRRTAICRAVNLAAEVEDTVVLLAGKGHESYHLIGGQRLIFDDRVVAREAVGSWRLEHERRRNVDRGR